MKYDEMPLGRLLAVSGRMVTTRLQRVLEEHGLSQAGWVVLVRLAESDRLPLSELAQNSFVSAATITGVVDTLERDGFVERVREDADRRVVRLSLTKAGRARLAEAKQVVEARMGPVFADLPARDEAVIRRFLTRTISRLEGSQLQGRTS